MHDLKASDQATNHRRRDIVAGLLIGLCALGIFGAMVLHLVKTDQTKARKVGLPLPVEVLPATVRPLHISIGASGVVQPDTTTIMTARVSARVLEVPVDLGQVVTRDALLVELDGRLFAANLASAKSVAEHAERQVERMTTLEAKGFGAPADTEKARADAAAARQLMVQAEIDLASTRVTSPASAVILSRSVNPGEATKMDQELFQLGTIESVLMVADVSEDKVGFVQLGMRGEVGTDAFPGETFIGEVVKIEGRVSTTTRTFGVYIRIQNPDLRLKPGITGYARLVSTRTALAITSTAVINPVEDRPTVFVVDGDNAAHIRQVRCGIIAEGMTEILDGLQEGERVVTVGQLELHDHDRVRVNQASARAK